MPLETVKSTMFDDPPPGLGFVTETGNVPAVARSVAESPIVSCVLLTKLVARAVPLKLTDEELTKPFPLMVRVSDAEPAEAELGERYEIPGTGLPVTPLTVKARELVVEPLLVATVTEPEEAPAGTLVWIDDAVELVT